MLKKNFFTIKLKGRAIICLSPHFQARLPVLWRPTSLTSLRVFFPLPSQAPVFLTSFAATTSKFPPSPLIFFFYPASTQSQEIILRGASLVAQTVKNLLAVPKTWVQSWVGKIPQRREWLPTPVLLPGESHGECSLEGYSPWGRKEWGSIKHKYNPVTSLPKCSAICFLTSPPKRTLTPSSPSFRPSVSSSADRGRFSKI